MYPTRVKNLLVVILLLAGIQVSAQTGSSSNPNNGRENNPYSKFGIGEFINSNSAVLRGMGNVTSAFVNPYEMNTDNPASYSYIERTTFELGATESTRTIKAQDLTYTTGTATLSYFNIGFPVNKNAGFCIGFKPVTRVYYNMQDTLNITNSPSTFTKMARAYNGEGSLNDAYIGGAWRYKGLSIGANVGYMFGTLYNNTATIPLDSLGSLTNDYIGEFTRYTHLGGLHWKLGLMYEKKLDSFYTLRFGGTFTMSQNLTEQLNSFHISTHSFGDTIISDTSSNPGELHGKLKMPMSYSIGVMLARNEKWSVGLDYKATQWADFKSSPDSTLTSGVGKQSYKLSLGGEFTPDANSSRNYFSRITYRVGAYYGLDYLNINGTQLPCYGLTAGTSFPFRRSLSKVHLAFDMGRLGTTNNNLLQETYFRFTLGVSFNDRWFVKPRYE